MIVGAAIFASYSVSRVLYFSDDLSILNIVVGSLAYVLYCAIVSGLTNKLGFLMIELDVLREGNDSLLNSLEEGVVIVEENCSEVCFLNSAA